MEVKRSGKDKSVEVRYGGEEIRGYRDEVRR